MCWSHQNFASRFSLRFLIVSGQHWLCSQQKSYIVLGKTFIQSLFELYFKVSNPVAISCFCPAWYGLTADQLMIVSWPLILNLLKSFKYLYEKPVLDWARGYLQIRFGVLTGAADQDRSITDQLEGSKNMFRTWLFLRATPRSDLSYHAF